jgi:hypothetical protein
MGECHTMQDEMSADARRILRRIVSQKIIQFHDVLLRQLTSDNERFLRTSAARLRQVDPSQKSRGAARPDCPFVRSDGAG